MTRFICTCLIVTACSVGSRGAEERPNILIILADDLGYGDVGFTGSTEIKTPVLDNLARHGVVCSNGYVTHSYCGPSRAGLITGRHQSRFGMEINATYSRHDRFMGLPADETTFGNRLRAAGYRTGIIGKWHLGAAPNQHPNNRGFDYFYGFLAGGHCYWPAEVTTTMPLLTDKGKLNYGAQEGTSFPLARNDQAAEFDEYLTTALSHDAARFVSDGDAPFLLYLAYNAPHSPLAAPKETIAKYARIKDHNRRVYAAMVDEMDRGIGIVLDALKASGKYDNTLVFFLSDNGGVGTPPWNPYENWADNGPFRQGKASWMEGGIHVPYLVHWPKGLKPGTFEGLVSSLDIAATAVALSKGDASGHALEGVNLIPYLSGKKKGSPHAALYWRERDSTAWAVRTPQAKYVKNAWEGGELCLFDMVKDPYEATNIIDQAPEKRAELAKLWNAWNAENKGTMYMHAYEYQQWRAQAFEKLYEELAEKAANTPPVVIE